MEKEAEDKGGVHEKEERERKGEMMYLYHNLKK